MVEQRGVGLVLSGGGGKGAYEIGVWKALDEFGVTPNITAVSGTSVGALNGVLFAQGNCDRAEQIWSHISPEAVISLNHMPAYAQFAASASDFLEGSRYFSLFQSIHHWILKQFADQGFLSKEGLSKLIDASINLDYVMAFHGPIYAAAYSLNTQSVVYFDLKQADSLEAAKSRMLASASIPVVFGKTYIDGVLYWDGGIPGIGDNVPVQPLYDEGYRNLVVVHLSREEPVNREKFPGCNIIEIMPQEDLGGMFSGTMNFKASVAKENIRRGYQDTVRILQPLYQTGMALNQMYVAFQHISDEQKRFIAKCKVINQKLDQSGEEIDQLLHQLK